MRKASLIAVIALVFLLGVSVGGFAAKKGGVTAAAWQGASPEEAAANLLEVARGLAEDGSWENIHVGRVHYLSGDRRRAEAIFDRYGYGEDVEAGDVVRIARVYAEAGDWEQARPIFDRVLEMAPKDEDWLVEAGAYYNLNGDRETAERLFARGFASASKNLNNALNAAGSYVGVAPRKR